MTWKKTDIMGRSNDRIVFYALDDDHVRDLLAMGSAHAAEAAVGKDTS